MMEVDWAVESYPSATDFKLLPLFALFFLAARFFLDNFVFEHLARWLILGKEHVRVDIKEAHDTEKKIKKFKESAWKCIYFLSAEILALSVSYGEPWFTDTQYFWKGPGDQVWPDQKMKLTLKGLYMYVTGFYTYALFALVFWETRRSDFWVSMTHHLATLPLLLMAYLFRFGRVGAIVLALHDASDVFLEVGKMSKYSGYDQIANVAFPLFVLSFTLFRIIYFPVWVLRSTSYEILLTLNVEKHKVEGPLFYYAFNTLLFCLLILNLYWWVLMCRMLVRQIQERGKISDDVRSDSEGEDDHKD